MKKAFTLIELLVVVGILGVLMAALVVGFGDGPDQARAAVCLSNMKNLASAAQSYGMAEGYVPLAGSYENHRIVDSRTTQYWETPGWISWNSESAYGEEGISTSATASDAWNLSAYTKDDKGGYYCITNGALWKHTSEKLSVYQCPCHTRAMKKRNLKPWWSYVMNGKFGYGYKGDKFYQMKGGRTVFEDLDRADRRLLFAELQWEKIDGVPSPEISTSANSRNDCILQYSESDGNEAIGVNHKAGNDYVAHIVYADGHTEKLRVPTTMGQSALKDLTRWLCYGEDITFQGDRYQLFDNDDESKH